MVMCFFGNVCLPGYLLQTRSEPHDDTASNELAGTPDESLHERAGDYDGTPDQNGNTTAVSEMIVEMLLAQRVMLLVSLATCTDRSAMRGPMRNDPKVPSKSEAPTRPIMLDSSGPSRSSANMARKRGSANKPPTSEPS
jgi:hypothetical protein